jgi:hypothetical protein
MGFEEKYATCAVKVAVANLDGVQDEVVDDSRVGTPDAHAHDGHLVAVVQRHCLVLHLSNFCDTQNATTKSQCISIPRVEATTCISDRIVHREAYSVQYCTHPMLNIRCSTVHTQCSIVNCVPKNNQILQCKGAERCNQKID